jgi:hypothetical protein
MEVFNLYISKDILDNVIIPYLNLEDIIKTDDFYSFKKYVNGKEINIWNLLIEFKRIKMLKYLFKIHPKYDKEEFSCKVSEHPNLEILKFSTKNNIKFNSDDMHNLIEFATLKELEFLFQYKINKKYLYRDNLIISAFCFKKFKILNHFRNIDKSWIISEEIISIISFKEYHSNAEKLNWIYENFPKKYLNGILKILAKRNYISLILHIISKYKDKINSTEVLSCVRELYKKQDPPPLLKDIIDFIISTFIKELLSISNYELHQFDKTYLNEIAKNNNIITKTEKERFIKYVNSI